MKTLVLAGYLAATCLAVGQAPSNTWNSKAAAAYLDERAGWWMDLKAAQRDHGTFCVSCHTAVPYALARPSLRGVLAEKSASGNEQRLVDNVRKRVRMWQEVEPFYKGDPKPAESRGTEAIMNALILANTDATLSGDTKLAFDNMWALQQPNGALNWLDFHNAPWESGDSQFYGNALAAVAVGTAPGNYKAQPAIQDNLKRLRDYLSENRDKQSLVNRVVLLWASTKVPGLLTSAQQDAIVAEALSKQSDDGSWSLTSIVGAWKRHDGTPLETRGDGYATGLVTFVLQQTGVSCDHAKLERGLMWLVNNQNRMEGNWPGYSLNKERERTHVAYLFMSDAATAYAVMSLTQSGGGK
jgi:squalene-hopene/tetraprenyl-beta-curcumene cyclase